MHIKAVNAVAGLALVQTGIAFFPIEFGWPLLAGIVGSVLKREQVEQIAGHPEHVARNDHIPAIEGRAADINAVGDAESLFLTRGDDELVARDDMPEKRQSCPRAPNGVPQNVVTNCCNAIRGKTIQMNSVNTGRQPPDIRVRRIPYPCISAAPWLDPVTQGGGTPPFACGDDCLQWTNLNWDQYNRAKALFQGKS